MVRRLPGFAGLAALVFVAACGSGAGKPTRLPDRSPTPSVTASLTPEQQVEAAVRAYYAEVTRAAASGDVDPLASRSVSSCPCRRLVDYIRTRWRDGQLRGVDLDIKTVRVVEANKTRARAVIDYSAAAYEELNKEGQTVRRIPADPTSRDEMTLQLEPSRWLVVSVLLLDR